MSDKRHYNALGGSARLIDPDRFQSMTARREESPRPVKSAFTGAVDIAAAVRVAAR